MIERLFRVLVLELCRPENWEKFNGAQDNPGDSTDFLIPMINSNAAGYAELSVYDYLGLPTGVASSYEWLIIAFCFKLCSVAQCVHCICCKFACIAVKYSVFE